MTSYFAAKLDWLVAYMSTPEGMMQAVIVLCSATAIKLMVRADRWRVVGMAIGLLGQPLWFVTTIKAGQYGVFLLSCWYSLAYLQGLWINWGREKWQKSRMYESRKNTIR